MVFGAASTSPSGEILGQKLAHVHSEKKISVDTIEGERDVLGAQNRGVSHYLDLYGQPTKIQVP